MAQIVVAWLLPWFRGMWALWLLGDIGGGLGWLGFWPTGGCVTLWT